MKKSFTLIELIIVIVVMGILSNITFDILSKLYKNYIQTKEINKLNFKIDYVMGIVSSVLKDRVKNSVIITKYPSNFTDSDADKVDFKFIADLEDGDTGYKTLEWINKDYEAKNGMWDSVSGHIQTGWSGFIDLGYDSHVVSSSPKIYQLITLDSNFTIVNLIDRNITTALGYDEDPFDSNTTTLIFSGYDGGGNIVEDLNHSYGWYYNQSKGREAKAVFAIKDYKTDRNSSGLYTEFNITNISGNTNNTLYSRYFLTRSAYALVAIENNETRDDGKKINDYNITFVYNYQPWQGDWFKDGNKTLLATHVTEFRFKKDLDTPILRLYICIQSPEVIVENQNSDNPRYLTLCKEKAVF
jgi:prepilin-type N-terminal cleavage/methylation domain-containing protein